MVEKAAASPGSGGSGGISSNSSSSVATCYGVRVCVSVKQDAKSIHRMTETVLKKSGLPEAKLVQANVVQEAALDAPPLVAAPV